MNREQARNYLKSSGMSEEQIAEVESAFTCEDAISRQAVQIELKNCEVVDVRDENDNFIGYYDADTVDSIVRNLPSVSTEKTGRWIKRYSSTLNRVIYECSECGKQVMTLNIDAYDYCHGCGCRMGVEE